MKCSNCGKETNSVIAWHGKPFCSEKCFVEYLVKIGKAEKFETSLKIEGLAIAKKYDSETEG